MHTQAVDTLKYRQRLQAQIQKRRQLKLEKEQAAKNQVICAHEFKRYKEKIDKQTKFKGSDAYFIVSACAKCKTKKRLELVVVR